MKKYVLVGTDAFTKIVRLSVIGSKTPEEVAQAMLTDWCFVYGVPREIVTDQGLEFSNSFSRALWKALQLDFHTTTPYHPQTNAQAEVFNRTMKRALAAMLAEAEKSTIDWPLYVAPLMFAYNTSVNRMSKCSPFHAMFGYDPRVPFWDEHLLDLVGDGAQRLTNTQTEALLRHKTTQNAARRLAHNAMQEERERTKDSVEDHTPSDEHAYNSGDLVWVRVRQKTAINPKLAPGWEPGVVQERTGLSTYKVVRENRKRKRSATLNASELKPRSEVENSSQHGDEEELPEAEAIAAAGRALSHANDLCADDVLTLIQKGWTLAPPLAAGATPPPPPPHLAESAKPKKRGRNISSPRKLAKPTGMGLATRAHTRSQASKVVSHEIFLDKGVDWQEEWFKTGRSRIYLKSTTADGRTSTAEITPEAIDRLPSGSYKFADGVDDLGRMHITRILVDNGFSGRLEQRPTVLAPATSPATPHRPIKPAEARRPPTPPPTTTNETPPPPPRATGTRQRPPPRPPKAAAARRRPASPASPPRPHSPKPRTSTPRAGESRYVPSSSDSDWQSEEDDDFLDARSRQTPARAGPKTRKSPWAKKRELNTPAAPPQKRQQASRSPKKSFRRIAKDWLSGKD